jgi:methylglyoxal synthase
MKPITIALIAHDSKKDEMLTLVKSYKNRLNEFKLVATRGTGQMIQARTGLPVKLLQTGPNGGDQQIGALVTYGEVDAVFFLRDPLTAHSHEPDVSALLRVCDVHKVPLATNIATADAIMHTLIDHLEAWDKQTLIVSR